QLLPSRMRKYGVKAPILPSARRIRPWTARGRTAFLVAARGLKPRATCPPGWSCCLSGQISQSDQVVDRQAEDEHPTYSRPASWPRLAEQADRFQPAKNLLNAFAVLLADCVALVPRRAFIERTGAGRDILRHVRRHLEQPHGLHEVARVVGFVGAERDAPAALERADHLQGRGPLPVPGGGRPAPRHAQPLPLPPPPLP